MDEKRKQRIVSLAREHTLGSGRAEEMADRCQEPSEDELGVLSAMFGRITRTDVDVYCRAWDRCLASVRRQ